MAEDAQREAEQRDADGRSAPSGKVVYKAILKEGEEELGRASSALFWFAASARVWVIVILTYVVGLGELSHVIAGSVEVSTAAAMGQAGWAAVLGGGEGHLGGGGRMRHMVPCLAGDHGAGARNGTRAR